MANVSQRVAVNIVRGTEQQDTRWGQWASIYRDSSDPFAFWEITTTEDASANDLRGIAQQQTQGLRGPAGSRPGNSVNPDFAPFTSADAKNADNLNPYGERTAVLKIVKRNVKTITQGIIAQRVVGERIDKYNQVVQVTKPLMDAKGFDTVMETNAFLLQSAAESFQEKFQISETFGEPVFFAFGERQKIFQYQGFLFDSANWQWKEKFIDNYERYLRGSKAIENEAVAILITNTAIIRGQILCCQIGQSSESHNYASFSFSMFVQDRIPLEPIERTPQEQQAAKDSDPQIVTFDIRDKTGKADEVVKELKLTNGVIELPSGFQAANFGQLDPTPPVWWKPSVKEAEDAPVDGEAKAMRIFLPAAALYDPPDLLFSEAVPAKYLNAMIVAVQGNKTVVERPNLEAPPGNGASVLLSLATDRPDFGPWSQAQVFRDIGTESPPSPGAARHTQNQIDSLEKIAKAGNLFADISMRNLAGPTYNVVRKKVASFTRLNGQGKSQSTFEFTTDSPLTPGPWGLAVYSNSPLEHVFTVRWYEDQVFTVTIPERRFIYHVIGSDVARRVGGMTPSVGQDGLNMPKFSFEKHVLTDPLASFQTELTPFLGNAKIFVRIKEAVVDEDSGIFEESTDIQVKSIISETQLQLGLLRKSVANGTKGALERQRIGKMVLPSYSVVLKRDTGIVINEAEIKQAVANPPTGAFSDADLSKAKVVGPLGAFKLEKGKHYTA